MNKSIYEEAVEIMVNSILPRESNKTNKLKVIKALEKAKKQEKLLELYKELSKLKDDVIHLVMFGNDYEHLRVKTVKIEQQIKELENEAFGGWSKVESVFVDEAKEIENE